MPPSSASFLSKVSQSCSHVKLDAIAVPQHKLWGFLEVVSSHIKSPKNCFLADRKVLASLSPSRKRVRPTVIPTMAHLNFPAIREQPSCFLVIYRNFNGGRVLGNRVMTPHNDCREVEKEYSFVENVTRWNPK